MRAFNLALTSLVIIGVLLGGIGQAFSESPTISKIIITGNKRIEAAAIGSKLISQVGRPYSSDNIREDIKAIYKMGFFDQVVVDLTDGALTYIITEKPTLEKIEFEGNDALSDTKLLELIKSKAFTVFDVNKINEDRKAILHAYEEKGYYLAELSYEIKDVTKDNQATLVFKINEGKKIQIKQITFLGNEAIPDDKLRSIIQSRESDILSFVTRFGTYQDAILDRDVQILNYFYYTRGYVQAIVSPPEIYITPDKQWIYITIHIEEGPQFTFGQMDVDGDLLFPKEELMNSIDIKDGQTFNNEIVNREVMKLATKYKDEGYAFANVIPVTSIREAERKVDILFTFEKGEKVYIGEINFINNTKTRDKVLRRELRIHEGELYNETRVQESLANIRRLGFFSNVTIDKPQGRKSDVVDLEITVEEKSTGTLNVGAGYSSTDGFVLTAQISEENFLGYGHHLTLNANLSKLNQRYNLSYRWPYFMDSTWLVGADLYRTRRLTTNFGEDKNGFDVLAGHPVPIIDYTDLFVTYKLEDVNLSARGGQVLPRAGSQDGLTSSVTTAVIRDQRDNRLDPREGSYQSASFEYSGLGGDRFFMKGLFEGRLYFPLPLDMVLKGKLAYGIVWKLPDNDIPLNERFILGGVNSLRGYEPGTIGSIDSTGFRIGGSQMVLLNLEHEIPIVPDVGIRFVTFYDAGSGYSRWDNVWTSNDLQEDRIRQDIGVGLRWFSPMGPLRFEWGIPLDREPGEEAVNFQFAIQPPF